MLVILRACVTAGRMGVSIYVIFVISTKLCSQDSLAVANSSTSTYTPSTASQPVLRFKPASSISTIRSVPAPVPGLSTWQLFIGEKSSKTKSNFKTLVKYWGTSSLKLPMNYREVRN